jgi:hypothetical protein
VCVHVVADGVGGFILVRWSGRAHSSCVHCCFLCLSLSVSLCAHIYNYIRTARHTRAKPLPYIHLSSSLP